MWRVIDRTRQFRHTIYLRVDASGTISQLPKLLEHFNGRKFETLCNYLKCRYPKSFKREQWIAATEGGK